MITTILTLVVLWYVAGLVLNLFFSVKPLIDYSRHIEKTQKGTQPVQKQFDLIKFFEELGNVKH